MRLDGDLVARFHRVGFPALGADLTSRAHFKRPLEGAAGGGIQRGHVQPAMRIGKLEFRQRSRDGDRLFLIKHCERMVRLSLNGKDGNDSGDEAGHFHSHGILPWLSHAEMVVTFLLVSIEFLYHDSPKQSNQGGPMRAICFVIGTVLIASSLTAAAWKEYPQRELGFLVEFP